MFSVFYRILELLQKMYQVQLDTYKLLRLKIPGRVYILITGEKAIPQVTGKYSYMLQFKLVLPPVGAPDVVSRELTYAVGVNEPVVEVLEATTTERAELQGNDNDSVTGTLIDIDDAGNRSEPSNFDFILTDTIAPPSPGEIGLVVTSES